MERLGAALPLHVLGTCSMEVTVFLERARLQLPHVGATPVLAQAPSRLCTRDSTPRISWSGPGLVTPRHQRFSVSREGFGDGRLGRLLSHRLPSHWPQTVQAPAPQGTFHSSD